MPWAERKRLASFNAGFHRSNVVRARAVASFASHSWHYVVQRSFGGHPRRVAAETLAGLIRHKAAAHRGTERFSPMWLVDCAVEPVARGVVAEMTFVERALYVRQINLADAPVTERPRDRHRRRLCSLAYRKLGTVRTAIE